MDFDLEMVSAVNWNESRVDTKISGFLGIEKLKLCFC